MANQRSLSELIDQAEETHKDQSGKPLYSYKKIKFAFANDCIWEIDCIIHNNTFFQNFRKHLSGQTGCSECSSEKKANKTLKERAATFIKLAQAIHINKLTGQHLYDYSKVIYSNNKSKIIICCRLHGDFKMSPANHTHKTKPQQCQTCSGRHIRTKEEFIKEAQRKHVDNNGKPLYNYSGVNYIDTITHVLINCEKHKIKFRQTPTKHLSGQKCRDCSNEIVSKKNTMSKEDYIKAAQKVHLDSKGKPKYDYSQVVYKNNHTKITIICPHHGPFPQTPSAHKDNKTGCPSCRSSKGEQIIAYYLSEKKVKFYREFTFEDCLYKRKLPFDFKLELQGKDILIEYQGEIHFKPVKYSKTDETSDSRFNDVKTRDKIKKEYAKKHGIELIEFTYEQSFEEIRSQLESLIK
jgi:hypothetical protein